MLRGGRRIVVKGLRAAAVHIDLETRRRLRRDRCHSFAQPIVKRDESTPFIKKAWKGKYIT